MNTAIHTRTQTVMKNRQKLVSKLIEELLKKLNGGGGSDSPPPPGPPKTTNINTGINIPTMQDYYNRNFTQQPLKLF